MSAPSKAYTIQLVKIQPEERLATASELNPAPGGVTCHREARGMGYRAATQVKGLSHEITIISEADDVHLFGRQYSHSRYWRGYASPTGSETVARYQKDSVGTREAQCISRSFGICDDKPINGKESQMMHWESDQLIVVMKQGNACRAKGLARKLLGQGYICQTQNWETDVNKTEPITYLNSGEEAFSKSRMRENLKSGSVRGFIVDSEKRWL